MIQQDVRLCVAEKGGGGFEMDGGADASRRRWKPAANHPWRQYRSVYLQKKRVMFLKQQSEAVSGI
jgi:hypothetical protein